MKTKYIVVLTYGGLTTTQIFSDLEAAQETVKLLTEEFQPKVFKAHGFKVEMLTEGDV